MADQLSKLADLRDRGVISAEEFEREKAKVLASGFGWVRVDLPVQILALFGLAFLLFLAGLEIDVQQLRGRLLRFAVLGYLVTLVLGYGAAARCSPRSAGCRSRCCWRSRCRPRRSAWSSRYSRTPARCIARWGRPPWPRRASPISRRSCC